MKFNAFILTLSMGCLSMAACKQKEKSNEEKFFPVLSFIQGQVAAIDTSLYNIRKLVYIDSLRTDTIYIPREQFRAEAKDFLSIPDISSSKYSDRYTEDKQIDETIDRVLLTYLPVKPEKEEIQRQEVLIKQSPSANTVTNIIINRILDTKDSMVQKKLLWNVNRNFQVVTTKQLKGQPETTSTVEVIWGENE